MYYGSGTVDRSTSGQLAPGRRCHICAGQTLRVRVHSMHSWHWTIQASSEDFSVQIRSAFIDCWHFLSLQSILIALYCTACQLHQ